MQTNLAMMRNLMDPLLPDRHGLRHVSVLQGTKAYGSPRASTYAIRRPRKASRAITHANFYWLQEDYIREADAEGGLASPSGGRRSCSAGRSAWP